VPFLPYPYQIHPPITLAVLPFKNECFIRENEYIGLIYFDNLKMFFIILLSTIFKSYKMKNI
jgi:hypothetical protein